MKPIMLLLIFVVWLCYGMISLQADTKVPFAEGQGFRYNGSEYVEAHISTDDYLGKYVVVPFLSTYCPPCVKNLPKLKKYYERYSNENVVIVGVAIEPPGGEYNLKRLLDKADIPGAVICEFNSWNSKIAERHAVRGIPYYFALDRTGRVIERSTSFRKIFMTIKKELKDEI